MFKLPFLGKTQKSLDKFLCVNINARDVRVLAIYSDGESFRIIGSGVQNLEFGSVRNGIIVEKDEVTEALKIATSQATSEQEEDIRNAIIGVDGGMCLGITTTVRSKRGGGPVEIKELNSFYEKLMEASYIQAKNRSLHTTGDPDIDFEAITTKNVYLKLDNQPVPSLEGQPGKMIEIAQFNAFAPSFHLKIIQNIVQKAGLKILAVGSLTYALTQWIVDSPSKPLDFVLINTSEDATDVAVIFGGGIISTQSLHIGFLHFIEGISDKMGLTRMEAENVLRVYMQGNLTESESEVVRSCINDTLDVWLGGLTLLFEEFSDVKTFAPKVFLTGYGVEIPDVYEALTKVPWTKAIPFKAPPEFSKLSFADMNKVSDSTGKTQTPDWINTATISIIYDELFKE
ncbi:hypothetical protein ACFL15_01430 [Patescibacteria group bacterium]